MTNGAFHPANALSSMIAWRNGMGHVCSTIVGKLTIDLAAGTLMLPEPIVLNERPSTNPRFVDLVNEAPPFLPAAQILLYGGPLRFVLEMWGGSRVDTSAGPHTPVGYSSSSPERAGLAPEAPVRGIDGMISIPDDLDERYFVSVPKSRELSGLRGDEKLWLEALGTQLEGRLPGLTVLATVQGNASIRVIALTPDMIVVDGRRRRISLVSRAIVEGPALLLSHALVATHQLSAADRGDGARAARPMSGPFPQNAFSNGLPDLESANRTISLGTVPATPFDAGFVPREVLSAEGITSTLSPDQEMAAKLKKIREELRRAGTASAAPVQHVDPASQKPVRKP